MGNLLPPIPAPVVIATADGCVWTSSLDLAAFARTQHGNVLQKAQEIEDTDPRFFAHHFQRTSYASGRSKREKAVWMDAVGVAALRFRFPEQKAAQAEVIAALRKAEAAALGSRGSQGEPLPPQGVVKAAAAEPKLDPVDAVIRQVLEGGGWVQYEADRPPAERKRLRVPNHMFADPVFNERLKTCYDAILARLQTMPAEGEPEPEPIPQPEPQPEPEPEYEPEPVDHPVVRLRDRNTFTTSLDVAAYCRKRHCDVLEAIREMHCSDSFRERNFRLTYVSGQAGAVIRQMPVYEITRSGAAFLIGGFTGPEAGAFKEAYIDEFDRMEAALKAAPQPDNVVSLDELRRLPTGIKALLIGLEEDKEAAERRAEEAERDRAAMLPKAEAFDHYEKLDGLTNLRGAAKLIGVGEQELKHKCFELGWFYWNNGEWAAKAELVTKGYFDHKPVKYFDRRNRECWKLQVMFTMAAINRLMVIYGRRTPPQGEFPFGNGAPMH